MHVAAYQFVERTLAGKELKGKAVVEFGSRIINESVRPLFEGAKTYVGVDQHKGRGVDVVADAATYDAPESADILVCCEMLEHTRDPQGILVAAAHTLKPGGLLIVTTAAAERTPHSQDGHRRIPRGEPYQSITPEALAAWLEAAGFVRVKVTHDAANRDLYAVAYRTKVAAAVAEPDPITTPTEEDRNG